MVKYISSHGYFYNIEMKKIFKQKRRIEDSAKGNFKFNYIIFLNII